MRAGKKKGGISGVHQVVVVSDIHAGCRMGLCPVLGVKMDDGGIYVPSPIQFKMYQMWREFWDEWVPKVTQGEPYDVVFNGDAVDGCHHNSTHQWSHNMKDQQDCAFALLEPVARRAARYYHIRGTEAHVGQSGVHEEQLAQRLGAVPNAEGQYARWELWHRVSGHLVHFLHHVGSTGSAAYEATAVHKEMTESFVEAGRWEREAPQVVVRSHRHRHIKVEIAGARGYYVSVVTPAWQAKTPFTWKIPGARLSQPQFGGLLIRKGDEELHTRAKVWSLDRTQEG